MDITRFLTRRNIIIGSISLIGISILILLISMSFRQKTETVSFKRLSLQYPLAIANNPKDNSIIFSNGRSFVGYDIKNNKLKTLTKSVNLPEIGSIIVRADGQGALIQTTQHIYNDNLANTLTQKSLPLDEPYWWYVDFAKDNYQLLMYPGDKLPAKFRTAQWLNDGQFITSSPLESKTRIIVYKSPTETNNDYVIDGVVGGFKVSADKLIYQANNKIYSSTLGQKDAQILLENAISAQFSRTTDWVQVFQSKNDTSETSLLFNIKTKAQSNKTNAYELRAGWSTDGNTLFTNSTENSQTAIKTITTSDQKSHELLTKDLNTKLSNIIFAQSAKFFIGTDADNNLYLSSSDLNVLNKFSVPKNFKTIVKDNITIEYFVKEGYFVATIDGTDTPETRQKIDQLLQSAGVNPETVTIRYTFFSTAGRSGGE